MDYVDWMSAFVCLSTLKNNALTHSCGFFLSLCMFAPHFIDTLPLWMQLVCVNHSSPSSSYWWLRGSQSRRAERSHLHVQTALWRALNRMASSANAGFPPPAQVERCLTSLTAFDSAPRVKTRQSRWTKATCYTSSGVTKVGPMKCVDLFIWRRAAALIIFMHVHQHSAGLCWLQHKCSEVSSYVFNVTVHTWHVHRAGLCCYSSWLQQFIIPYISCNDTLYLI